MIFNQSYLEQHTLQWNGWPPLTEDARCSYFFSWRWGKKEFTIPTWLFQIKYPYEKVVIYLLSFLETNPMCSGSNFHFWWTQRSKCVFWLVELRILVDFAPFLSLRHLQWDLPTALKFPSLGQETQLPVLSRLNHHPAISSYAPPKIAILMVNMMENDGKMLINPRILVYVQSQF